MSYQYTDEELNHFNRHENVYSVDPNYADKHNHKVITENPKNGDETNTITVDGQEFRVLATKNDPNGTGFQGMAVAPVDRNGNVDTNNVCIVAAGTESGNITDMHGAAEEMTTGISPQYDAAEAFYEEVEAKGYKVSQVSGYSQSAYMLKVGANHQVPATVYNGWFSYNSLTDVEAAYMDQHPDDYVNYTRKNDSVVRFNKLFHGDAEETHGTVIEIDGSSHNIADWQFKNGQVVDENGQYINMTEVYNGVETMASDYMKGFYQEKRNQLGADGFSHNEMIFLDYLSANAAAQAMVIVAQFGYESIQSYADQAGKEAQDLYDKLTSDRPWSVDKLTDDEILAVYAESGLTYDYMVTKVEEHFQKKAEKASTLAGEFSKLAQGITSGINEIMEADTQLAGEINGWISGN